MKLSGVNYLLIVAMYIALSNAQNYCQICSDHTMCRFRSTSPANSCRRDGVTPRIHPMTQSNINAIVNRHNQLRQKVASGQERLGSPGGQYRARQMPNLVWDQELANIAQRWANQCSWGHDSCRNVARFYVGQNIAQQGRSNPISDSYASELIQDMINAWYNEVKYYPRDWVKKFTSGKNGGQDIGHYTQIVWAKTTRIGCAAINYKADATFYQVYLVCNYGPGGNILNTPVYEIA